MAPAEIGAGTGATAGAAGRRPASAQDRALNLTLPREEQGVRLFGGTSARYHKRSNVESTFAMIKAKLRDHVRAKTPVAMVNEVLCKIICHNVCVLIQESHELGIEVEFQKQ